MDGQFFAFLLLPLKPLAHESLPVCLSVEVSRNLLSPVHEIDLEAPQAISASGQPGHVIRIDVGDLGREISISAIV